MAEVVYQNVPTTPVAASETQSFQSLNNLGALKADQVTPPLFQLAQAGRVYIASTGVIADGVAPMIELPYTGAYTGIGLYNGAAAGRGATCLVILSVSAFLCSGTPGLRASLFGGIGRSAAALATTSGNYLVSSSGSTRTTSATLKSSTTLATNGLASMCLAAFGSEISAAAGVGGAMTAHIPWGSIVIPPLWTFGAFVLSPAGTTPLYGFTVQYAEVESYLV